MYTRLINFPVPCSIACVSGINDNGVIPKAYSPFTFLPTLPQTSSDPSQDEA